MNISRECQIESVYLSIFTVLKFNWFHDNLQG